MPKTETQEAEHGSRIMVAFIRSNHRYADGVETIAQLQVLTKHTNRVEFGHHLREAVHAWTLATELGRQVRLSSSGDTNIGDLASYGVFENARCPVLDSLLAEHGIRDARLLPVFDDGPTLPYDMVLVKPIDEDE